MRERRWAGPALRTLAAVLVAGAVLKLLVAADPVASKVQGPDTLGNPLSTAVLPPQAVGSLQTQLAATANTAATAQTISLAHVSAQTTYVSGIYVNIGGATAATVVTVTLSQIQSGPLQFDVAVPTTISQNNSFSVQFNPPLAANGTNVSPQLATTSPGAGNTLNVVSMWGFRQ